MDAFRRFIKRASKRSGRTLCLVGWLLFFVSLGLPAFAVFAPVWGWQCAYVYLLGSFSDLVAFSLSAGNLLLILSPLFLAKARRHSSQQFISLLLLAAALWASCWGILLSGAFQVGYYVWALSFWLVTVGSLLHWRQTKPRPAAQKPVLVYRPRTPEEMAAERELKEFLRSSAMD